MSWKTTNQPTNQTTKKAALDSNRDANITRIDKTDIT